MKLDYARLRVVSGLGLCQLIAFGTSLYLLTALSAAIVRQTGWSLDWVVGGYSAGVLLSATVSARAGRYVGAGRGRSVLMLSSLLFAAGLGLMAMATILPVYLFAWGVMGLAMGTGLYDVAFGTVGRLYGHGGQGGSARAAIIQIALWGGFASTTFWPLSHWLETQFGWRATCLIFAGLHLAICLPVYWRVVPPPEDAAPASRSGPPPVVRPQGGEWPIYLALGVVITLEMAIVAVMSVHMHAILTSRGLALTAAVSLSAIVGPSQVLARVMELTLGRRWPAYLSLCLGVVSVTAGIVLISLFTGLNMPALMLYGAGLGVVSITSGTVPLAIFGPERYPPFMGRLRRVGSVVQAVAPTLGAVLLSRFGAGALLALLLVMAVICLAVSLYLAQASHRFLQAEGAKA